MKSTLTSLFALTLLSVTAAQSQVSEQGATLPFKARLAQNSSLTPSTRSVEYIFSVFNEASGGTKLFEERQSLQVVDGNLYAQLGSRTPGGIPAQILQNNSKLWIELAKASSPWAAEQPRLLINLRPAPRSGVSPDLTVTITTGARLCYTCGGLYPVFSGSWGSSPQAASELGPGCSGTFGTTFNDHSPYLCSPN
jgi:hypothetical protein